ncbi:MAG: isoprenylcysteine carboxylmethyltransferase family protein [Alphaproteobacteria bacterium]
MVDTYLMIYVVFSRLFELVLSKKNTKRLLEAGAEEYYPFHYKFIVLFHVIFVSFFLVKSFFNANVNIQYLYFFFFLQLFRYFIIYQLGKFWTTRILVINKPLVKTWIFKYLRHPNYLVVFSEIILICLFFNDFYSLIIFCTINSILISIRIHYEEKANKFRQEL